MKFRKLKNIMLISKLIKQKNLNEINKINKKKLLKIMLELLNKI